MSLISDLLTSAENLREEVGHVYDAGHVLHLKVPETKEAWQAARRLDNLVRHALFVDQKNLDLIQQAADLTELVRSKMLIFSFRNGLNEEQHSNYTTSVEVFLGDLKREAEK